MFFYLYTYIFSSSSFHFYSLNSSRFLRKRTICPICDNILKRKDTCIQCDSCEDWIHLKCSLLSIEEFDLLSHSDDKWCCSKCILEKLPFHNTNNNELILVNLGADSTINNTLLLIPNSDNDFISECYKISINSEILF